MSNNGLYGFPIGQQGQNGLYGFPKTKVLWTPAALGPTIWLDAADSTQTTITSGLFDAIKDKSGQGRNQTLVTGSKPSATTLNGLTAMGFNGSSQWFNTDIPAFPATDLIAVGQRNAAVPFGGLMSGSTSHLILDSTGASALTSTGYTIYINGVATTAIGASSPFIWSTSKPSSNQARTIGQEYNTKGSTRAWNGIIGEIVGSTNPLSSTDRQKLEGYLAWKWGIVTSLDSSHPYKFNPPYL